MTKADKEIAAAIDGGQSLLVDAGAGSGKTSSLVRALLHIKSRHHDRLVRQRQRAACITFTKVARDEIIERTERDDLFRVSTIHDFLWAQIAPFQTELKAGLVTHNAGLKASSTRKQNADELETALRTIDKIQYSDRGSRFLEGQIHHDDVISIAAILFEHHPVLAKLTGAQFPFIFVDEYQDTAPEVVEILLDRIRTHAPDTLIGFFGDKAQAIYDKVVGELTPEHQATLCSIQKEENYRCAKAVIAVLNHLRTDIKQYPAGNNADGAAVYVGLPEGAAAEEGYALAQERLVEPPVFENAKALYLTHRLIAARAGYGDLYDAYRTHGGYRKDQFEKGEDPASRCLAYEIDLLAEYWETEDHGEALRLLHNGGFELRSLQHKGETAKALDQLVAMVNAGVPVGDVVAHVQNTKLIKPVDRLIDGLTLAKLPEKDIEEDEKRRWKLFRALRDTPSNQLRIYRNVVDQNTPYSTKHGVKGAEFDTVIVIIDDKGANWTKYAFGKALVGEDTSAGRLERTRNLLYVCLSRAKVNLVVVDLGFEAQRKAAVEALFEPENVMIA